MQVTLKVFKKVKHCPKFYSHSFIHLNSIVEQRELYIPTSTECYYEDPLNMNDEKNTFLTSLTTFTLLLFLFFGN